MTDSSCQTSARRKTSQTRGGFGLIETVGTIVTTGLLLSFAAMVLNRAFVSHQLALEHFQRMQRMQNAGNRFRADVHAAGSCEVSGESLSLSLSDGRTIRYGSFDSLQPTATQASSAQDNSAQGNSLQGKSPPAGPALTRIMSDGDQELGREQWRLDRIRQVRWAIDREGQIPLIRCELTSEEEEEPLLWMARMPRPWPAATAAEPPQEQTSEKAGDAK